jgi:HK97 family phage major capsid protein
MKLSDMNLTELRQRRAQVLDTLMDANADKDPANDDSRRIAVNGLEIELQDLRREIDKREGREREEAAHARALDARQRGGNGNIDFGGFNYPGQHSGGKQYEVTDLIKPDQSVRGFFQDRGLIGDRELEGLTTGGYLRSLVTGGRSEAERRALSEGNDSQGGYTVPNILLPQVIDLMRAQQVCIRAGAQTLMITSDQNRISKLASDPVCAWRAENASVAESDPTFAAVDLIPETLAVFFKAPVELLEDSPNIESMLQRSLTGSLAVALDKACLVGTGQNNEPLGLMGLGINTVPALGPFQDYDDIVNAMASNWVDNETETSAVIMSPVSYATLAKLREIANGQYNAPTACA